MDIDYFDIQLCFLAAWRFVLAWPPKAQGCVLWAGSMAHCFTWVYAGLRRVLTKKYGMNQHEELRVRREGGLWY